METDGHEQDRAGRDRPRHHLSHLHRGVESARRLAERRRRSGDDRDHAAVDRTGPGRSPVSVLVSVLVTEEIHKYYDLGETRVHARRAVNASIDRRAFVAIMGSSGSGKSTFMNILGCLDKPTQGRYILDGTDVSQLTKRDLAAIRN